MSRNPFLVVRFIFFAILVYLNLFILIFAALNIAAVKSPQTPAPGAAVFLVFNCCLLYLCLFVGLSELVISWTWTSIVKLECVWTAILSVLELAATVTMNVNGPPTMCEHGDSFNLAACTSSSVLVPVTWLATFTLIAYCLTLAITTIMHAQTFHDVWSVSVYAVPWFGVNPPVAARKAPITVLDISAPMKDASADSEVSSRISREMPKPGEDVEAALPKISDPISVSLNLISAPWAIGKLGRRGVDPPFATKDSDSSVPPARPRPPRPGVVTRYFELSWFSRKSQVQPNPQTPGGAFTRTPGNEDAPIPLPRLSEWIRADAAKGINVHTIPPVSP